MSNYGFVYVMRNQCIPGLYKVGYTDRAPLQRCDELSRSTGVPFEFELVCYGEIANAQQFEASIHSAWSGKRLNKGREFFKLARNELLDLAEHIDSSSENFIQCAAYLEETTAPVTPYPTQAARYFLAQDHDESRDDWGQEWHQCDAPAVRRGFDWE